MRTDTVIRTEGTQALMENLGLVEAERFIMLIQKEIIKSKIIIFLRANLIALLKEAR